MVGIPSVADVQNLDRVSALVDGVADSVFPTAAFASDSGIVLMDQDDSPLSFGSPSSTRSSMLPHENAHQVDGVPSSDYR